MCHSSIWFIHKLRVHRHSTDGDGMTRGRARGTHKMNEAIKTRTLTDVSRMTQIKCEPFLWNESSLCNLIILIFIIIACIALCVASHRPANWQTHKCYLPLVCWHPKFEYINLFRERHPSNSGRTLRRKLPVSPANAFGRDRVMSETLSQPVREIEYKKAK